MPLAAVGGGVLLPAVVSCEVWVTSVELCWQQTYGGGDGTGSKGIMSVNRTLQNLDTKALFWKVESRADQGVTGTQHRCRNKGRVHMLCFKLQCHRELFCYTVCNVQAVASVAAGPSSYAAYMPFVNPTW